MGRLEDDLLKAWETVAVSESKVQTLRQQIADLPAKEVTSATAGHGNAGTDAMRDQLFALQVKEQEARATTPMRIPRWKPCARRSWRPAASCRREDSTAAPKSPRPTTVRTRRPSWPCCRKCRAGLVPGAGEQATAAIGRSRGGMKLFNQREVQIAKLERDIDLQPTNYRRYSVNFEQARIDQALESQRMSNVSIVEAATYYLPPGSAVPTDAQHCLGAAIGDFHGTSWPWRWSRKAWTTRIRMLADVGQRLSVPLVRGVGSLVTERLGFHGPGRGGYHGGNGNGHGHGHGSNGNGNGNNNGSLKGPTDGSHGNGSNGNGSSTGKEVRPAHTVAPSRTEQ